MKLNAYFIPQKRNSKLMKKLYLTSENIQFPYANIEENVYGIGLGNIFMSIIPKSQVRRANIPLVRLAQQRKQSLERRGNL
jgi:hypothetical protein